MKRRILCFIISLALCLNLCPIWAAADVIGLGTNFTDDVTCTDPFEVSDSRSVDTSGHTIKGLCSPVVRVTGSGELNFTGNVRSQAGVGIQVLSGGVLNIMGDSDIMGITYALEIASGAKVKLYGGTYTGVTFAIKAEDGNFAAMLGENCAFFDEDNHKLLLPEDVADARSLSVKECPGLEGHGWTPTPGTTEHTWTCPYCGAKETGTCSFSFDENGRGDCVFCENAITISVDETSLTNLVYDGTQKPGTPPPITVTLADGSGKGLVENTDYTVKYDPRTDAGEIEVTVTGVTFDGTFTKTYHVEPDQPGIKWAADTCEVDYDGDPVDNLPTVIITIKSSEDLHPLLKYSYRKTGDVEFTDGLPTNAGTYEVKAYLEKSNNFEAAETGLLTLTVNKIPAVATAPTALTLTYNREAQQLVTAASLASGAAEDGAKIEYKLGDGDYSTEIPTGTNVSTYSVSYRVVDTENYNGQSGTLSARINHREIKPTVELEYYTTLYTGGDKEPVVTVKDGEYVIPKTEYAVAYSNNRNAGDATVTVNNAKDGNYKLTQATATFKITNKVQDALSITKQPDTVTYGDKFTLGTTGGSGNGDVTWEIIDVGGVKVAEIGQKSGQVTIVGDGEFTVKATKSGTDANVTNYETATATWTAKAEKKKVTATVTAEDKTYDGKTDATVHAVVEQGVLPGDVITIAGLTGAFVDVNAGENKTVNVTIPESPTITGKNSQHYDVTYSSTSVKATINKAVVHITTAPGAAELTYSGEAQGLLDDSVLKIDLSNVPADADSVRVEYSLSKDGTYSTNIPEGTNAGKYTVWYRVQETNNYTGVAPASVDVTIKKKPVEPTVELSETSYIYDGSAKEPAVTLYEADGTTLIPADQYTVKYSNNVNVGTTATVTVTAKADGNYTFDNPPVTKTFEITQEQAKVIAAPKMAGNPLVYNTYAQELVTAGTASGGTMVYSLDEGETKTYSADIPTGKDAKDYKVYYKVKGDGNHSDSAEASLTVIIAPKVVNNPTIELRDGETTLVSYTYDGSAKKPTVVVKDGSTVIGTVTDGENDEYNVVYSDNVDAGKGTVSISDKPGGNYTVTGSTTFTILKADIVFSREPADASVTYNGTPQELLKEGAFEGGTVEYALGSKTSTYTSAIPTAAEAGKYKVYYKVTGDKNHNDYPITEVEANILRKPLTEITIELSPKGFEYDGTAKMPAVTVKDGNTVLPEGEYSWKCNVDAPTNFGTYTITISDKADGNYDLSKLVSPANEAAFTIGRATQEDLVIDSKPAVTNYGGSFTLTTSGGSGGGNVTWSVTGTAATVNPATGEVKITGVGEVTIKAEKAADTNYLAASAQWTFTAAPKPVTASVTVNNKPYDGNTSASVASASITTETGDTVTIDPASITATFDTAAVGTGKTVTLDISKVKVDGAAAEKYAIGYPATVTADITKATTKISKHPGVIAPLTYSGQPQALVTAGETNVGFIVYSLDGNSFSPEIPTGTNAGTYNVYYKVDETADYSGVAVNETPLTVTIGPKPITPKIELSETSYLYDGTKKSPKITVMDDKAVIDAEQYQISWDKDLTSAGTHTLTVSKIEGKNYTFDDATATVEIVAGTQGAVKITGKPEHVYYGDTITTLDTTGGIGNGTVTWSIAKDGDSSSSPISNPSALQIKDTGKFTVTAERAVPNYATVSDTWTFTVEPKPVTAVVTVKAKAYDGTTGIAAGDITATVNTGDLVDPTDSITITGLKGTYDNANAGTGKVVTLDRSGANATTDDAKYTVIIPETATGSITPKEVIVTVTLSDHDLKTEQKDGNKIYFYTFDGTEKNPTVTVTANYNNAELTANDYTVSITKNKNVGTADVTVTAKAGGNYTFAAEPVHFEIRNGAAVLTETPKAKDLTYDGTEQDLVTVGTATGGSVVYSLTKEKVNEGDKDPYSETIPQKKDAGTYTVYYKVRGDGNHDDTAPGQVSVTIRPKEITPIIALNGDGLVTEADGTYSYVYDGSAKKPTVTVTGGVDTNAIAATEYTVSYRDNTNAGTATVTVSDNNGGNYIVNGTATFQITQKAPAVTAPVVNTGLQYNGQPQELVKAGVSHDGTVQYSVNGGNYSAAVPTATSCGDYEIKYKVVGDANHSNTDPVALEKVTIAKNSVNNPVISLSSERFTFNGNQQKPTVTVYDDKGLVIPEYEYSVAITGGNMVDVAVYTVTVTTPDSSNYEITTGNDENGVAKNTRTFKIVPANQETISITGTKAQVRYGDTIQLGVSGGTGSGTVTWTVTDAEGNAVNSSISSTGLLTVKDVGKTVKVTVKRSAGGNYTEVSATWEFSAAQKQVTAVVTADDRDYDDGNTSVTVTATVPASELVEGDTITITDLTGEMDDPNVGTDKKVTVGGGTISDTTNYDVTIPKTTTVTITAVAATVDADKEPTPKDNLTYNASQAQELVTAGTATGGIMVYSLDGTTFTPSIPKAKDAGTYTVYFKAQGDGNHSDSTPKSKQVTIGKQDVTPQIELSPSAAKYDGEEHKPAVTLRDSKNNVIPASEYKVTYVGTNWTNQGTYTIKIEDIDGGNYAIVPAEGKDAVTATFTISTNAQNPLEITNKPGLVYYGDTFTLSAVGGSGNAAVTWSVEPATGVVEIDKNGFVKIVGKGQATITATKPGGDNYDTATATYPLNALPKPVTAIVTADDKVYTGVEPTTTTLHFIWNGLVGNDTIDTTALTGTFDNADAGQGKTVTIAGSPANDATSQKYVITIPRYTTASILKADTATPDLTANDRAYDGNAQPLVTGGDDNTRYSDSRDGVYSENVPTGTNAGTYTVWYKAVGGANHNDSMPQSKTVTISRKILTTENMTITLSGNDLKTDADGKYSYVFDASEKKPTVTVKDGSAVVPSSEYTVSYENNKNVSKDNEPAKVIITSNEGGNYTFGKQELEFTITSAAAQLTKSPEAKNLTYTGQQQELVTVGTAVGGQIVYLQDDSSYSTSIPKGTNAGTYTVTYKIKGDGNYADSTDTWTLSVTIRQKEVVSPKVSVSGDYTYDGSAKELTVNDVKVEDGSTTIPTSEYTVSCSNNINAGTATVIITNANGGNYIVNGSGTFIIGKADAAVGEAPTGNENLAYNGTAQELLATAGKASGGTMLYSLSETGEYSPVIPTGTAVDSYTVCYKVQGDDNHNDFVPESNTVAASIIVNAVENPTVQVTPEAMTYNGKKQEPTVTVKDGSGMVIDGSEYTVTYKDANNNSDLIQVGKYTLTIASKADGNYTFTATGNFEILPADQTPLTITGQRERVCYGDKFQLGTSGGSDGGTVEWKAEGKDASNNNIASFTNGLLEIKGVGSVTVTATCKAAGYTDQTATWSFYADKKPVTAVVTAKDKEYNGETDAKLVIAWKPGDLVGNDTISLTLTGEFRNASVGDNKTVDICGTAPADGNYAVTWNTTTTASITPANVTNVTAPKAAENLEYTGLPLFLVEAGSSTEGTLEYSTDGIIYFASLPTGTDAGNYDVWYRVKGDGNHNDTDVTKLTETTPINIAPQTVTDPTIELKPTGASFDGTVHKPEVTVKDNNGRVVPEGEYEVTYEEGKNWKDVGKYKVTITDVDGGNYNITATDAAAEAEFEILATGQSPLTITGKPGTVHYGDSFTLSAVGGSGTGTVKWDVTQGTDVAEINQNGLVKFLKSGSVTITATKVADGNFGESSDTWTFSVEKKPVKAVVTAKNKEYDTTDEAKLVITWKDGDLLGNDADEITLNLTGTFDTPDVGNNKTVTIIGAVPTSDKYAITWNTTTTASITAGAAKVTKPEPKELIYSGQPQELVNAGSAANGTIKYSLDGIVYGPNVPKGTNAGSYTVWYKVEGNENYKDVAPDVIPVTIAEKPVDNPTIELSPDSFDYDGSAKIPAVTIKDGNNVIPIGEYTVSYSSNVDVGTATVTIGNAPGGNYIVSGSTTFTIKSGAATLTNPPQERELTYNGKAQFLVTAGQATNGHLEYSTDGGSYSTAIPKGTDADDYAVYYKVVGNPGYSDTTPQVLYVTIEPKQVTPTVLVNGKSKYSTPYTGEELEPDLTVIVDGKKLSVEDDYYAIYDDNTGPGTATVTVQSTSTSNYQFYAVATFEITKAKADFLLEPRAVENLVYTGEAQNLVKAGKAKTGGAVVYSLDGRTYSPSIPKGTEIDDYVVFAKVEGDDTYADSDVVYVDVSISKNMIAEDKLNVALSDNSLKYTGSELKPTVTVRDVEKNVIISASEYSVSYKNNINVGQADVTVTSTTKNYSFSKTVHFTITEGDAPELTITGLPETVYYGDTLRLGTTGGSGTVSWSIQYGDDAATTQNNGVFKITGSGSVTIKATDGSSSDTWTFYAYPKPIKAIVTAADKTFDGKTEATFTVILTGLVSGDTIPSNSITVTGQFKDASAGADKTVYITGLSVPEGISGKYDISCPETTTATITQAPARVATPPQKVTQSLTYNGSAQPLVTEGTASDGKMMYSLDGISYVYDIPTGTDAKTYNVWYKAAATDKNHEDSVPDQVTNITISPNTDTPKVICTPDSFQFDGTAKAPTSIVVWDSKNHTIPESEYTVTVPVATAVGNYTVTVTDKPGGNYQFTSTTGGTFKIETGNQSNLTIDTEIYDVYYGDTFRLSATGGSGDGAIQWSIPESDKDIARISSSGVVTVTGTGGFTVEAYRAATDGYKQSNTVSLPFEAHAKPVTPIVTAENDKPYNGQKNVKLTAKLADSDMVGTDSLVLTVEGEFTSADVGTNKRVNITGHTATGTNVEKYDIRWPDSTTASIYKVDAKIENAPQLIENLTYAEESGQPKAQSLITGGTTVGNIGTIVYSTSEKGEYSTAIPKGTTAGTYHVWYKVADSINYIGIPAVEIKVEIKKADPGVTTNPMASGSEGQTLSEITFNNGGAVGVEGKFTWKDGNIKPPVGESTQDAIFTPTDTTNYNSVTIQVKVTVSAQDSSTNSSTPAQAQMQTTIRNGTASTVMSASDGNKLVQEAVANRSQNVVIKPNITGDVTKSEVSIPSSTVSKLSSDTDAALTVSSPVADVTIPNKALDTLGQAGGNVSVAVENAEQSVVLTVASGGETVKQVPGGVTLAVPVEDPAPGTVAVLVNEDGTRETIRNSVVAEGVMSIPLSGSATVEIVDNSKDFDDVPPESWEADAVDFASSHELFGGTSETTFSPDMAMSRGMLATVLYRLEGNPEMELTDAFSDVSDGAWYADGVAWAAENGIVGGYGDGQFGPNDDITREQFVVMLWRYAGSPEAGSQDLDFLDADQASGYATQALCWAVENGILNGVGGGMLDPRGTATRAQAAQLLKNFMEKT